MLAAKIANKSVGNSTGNNQYKRNSANLQNSKDMSVADAAKLLNVSERSVHHAKRIQSQGIPELIEKVEAGEVKVSVDVAQLPEDEQRHLVALRPYRGAGQFLKAFDLLTAAFKKYFTRAKLAFFIPKKNWPQISQRSGFRSRA